MNASNRKLVVWFASGCLFVALGVAVGRWLPKPAPPQAPGSDLTALLAELRSTRQQQAETLAMIRMDRSAPAAATALDTEELRKVVRSELMRPEEEKRAENADEDALRMVKSQYDDGLTIVRSAIQARRWTQSDKERLRQIMPTLTADQRRDLMLQLVVATNEGHLVPEVRGLPF